MTRDFTDPTDRGRVATRVEVVEAVLDDGRITHDLADVIGYRCAGGRLRITYSTGPPVEQDFDRDLVVVGTRECSPTAPLWHTGP